MILLIDTTQPKAQLGLYDVRGQLVDELGWLSLSRQSEELLTRIDQFLKHNHHDKQDLTKIMVNPGPGSYTGVRVGVTTANFLAISLNIPLYEASSCEKTVIDKIAAGQESFFSQPITPVYAGPPRITQKDPSPLD